MIWRRLPPLQALRNTLEALIHLPSDVAELGTTLRDVRASVEGLLASRLAPRPRWAQVLVLWSEPPRRAPVVLKFGEDDGADHELRPAPPAPQTEEPIPCCLSLSFNLADPEIKHRGVRSDTVTRPIPAGAWLVASGCLVSQVFIGNELQDVASGLQGLPLRYLRLRDPIGVGMYLRCGVQPDNGEQF